MTATAGRVSRSYTRARHLPWVLGKIGDWTIWLGPYNAAQLLIASVGAFVLIKTFSFWSWMGPVPVVAWAGAVWAARRTRVGGRVPLYVALGVVKLALQPRAGRMAGRPVRPARARVLHGGFHVIDTRAQGTDVPAQEEAAHIVPAPRAEPRHVRKSRRAAVPSAPRPVVEAPVPTALQRLMAQRGAISYPAPEAVTNEWRA